MWGHRWWWWIVSQFLIQMLTTREKVEDDEIMLWKNVIHCDNFWRFFFPPVFFVVYKTRNNVHLAVGPHSKQNTRSKKNQLWTRNQNYLSLCWLAHRYDICLFVFVVVVGDLGIRFFFWFFFNVLGFVLFNRLKLCSIHPKDVRLLPFATLVLEFWS